MSSYIQSYEGTCPDGTTDTMSKIFIDEDPAVLRLSDCIPVTGAYTLQLWVKASSILGMDLDAGDSIEHITATTEWTKHVITVNVSNSSDDSINIELPVGVFYLYHVKLETGEVASDWTSYDDNPTEIESTQLYRLSDKYKDSLSCKNGIWFIERNTKVMNFDGTESGWEQVTNNVYRKKISPVGEANATLPALCDRFTYTDDSYTDMEENNFTFANDAENTYLFIRVSTSVASTVAQFKTWLSTHIVNVLVPHRPVEYRLAGYLQNTLNEILFKDTMTVKLNNSHVDRLRGAVLTEPIILGTVNSDKSASILNDSDCEMGFIYKIHCQGEVVNPVIHHSESAEHIKINGRFKLDDVIIIDTRRGHKSLVRDYRGAETNIINSLDNTSKWLQLQTGYNHLIQSADSGVNNMDSVILYTNEYQGV